MPSPDVQYFLDCSVECGHMGADTHFYFMEIAKDADAVLDSYVGPGLYEPISSRRGPNFAQHWHGLIDTGLYMEENFLRWRKDNREAGREVSLMGLRRFRHVISEQVLSATHLLADNGHRSLTPSAMRLLDDRFGFSSTLGIVSRSLKRAVADLRGLSQDDLDRFDQSLRARQEENRAAYLEVIRRVRDGMGEEGDLPYEDGDSIHRQSTNQEIKRTKRAFAERAERNRRAIKRSVRFLSRLVGQETTRMFVGGQAIRFEGQLANYEVIKTGSLLNGHGGWDALAIYDKDHPDLRLCNLCIATDRVPLLDHVASLVMHIQTGNEEDILRIGNAARIAPEAYDKEWLAPHLPKSSEPLGMAVWAHRDTAHDDALTRVIYRYIFDRVIEPNLDVIQMGQTFNDRQRVVDYEERLLPLLPA